MLFNSFQFAYFFGSLLPVYWLLQGRYRWQNLLLLSAGYYFYACWNPKFLGLLVLSTVMDYFCGIAVDRIENVSKRKAFVVLSMALNLGMLGYFKYYNFFAESLQALLLKGGLNVSIAHLNVVLPIGISFYTFQSMSYVIDVYRKDIEPTRNFIEFATFVSFFPHLVAGPIMRPTTLLPQVSSPRRFNIDQFYQGSYLIFWGLVKKVVIADNLSVTVNDLFERWETIDGGLALLAIYAFAFQIYCDFSGYTDAARGIAKCLGFELALNFNLPYFSANPKEFWTRWHISLSSWLRDYLYITLGGNRGGNLMVYRNLMLTMVIGGLWHGAAWTFVLWGFYQGVLLVGHRIAEPWLAQIKPTDIIDRACWRAVRVLVMFQFVCFGWLIFRAQSVAQIIGMTRAIIERPSIPAASYLVPVVLLILPLLCVQFVQYLSKDLDVVLKTPWYVRSAFYTACFYAFILVGNFGGGQFIYFQF